MLSRRKFLAGVAAAAVAPVAIKLAQPATFIGMDFGAAGDLTAVSINCGGEILAIDYFEHFEQAIAAGYQIPARYLRGGLLPLMDDTGL